MEKETEQTKKDIQDTYFIYMFLKIQIESMKC